MALDVVQPAAQVRRVAKLLGLMALAIRFDELLRSGCATGLLHIAEIGHVSQPRVSQILSLTLLAPDIQEELMFLPRIKKGKPQISEKLLRPLNERRPMVGTASIGPMKPSSY